MQCVYVSICVYDNNIIKIINIFVNIYFIFKLNNQNTSNGNVYYLVSVIYLQR